jgi:hypothetical protein
MLLAAQPATSLPNQESFRLADRIWGAPDNNPGYGFRRQITRCPATCGAGARTENYR